MSDSSSTSGDSVGTSASSTSSRGLRNGKTKFERDVEAAQRKGASECKNLLHWEVKRIADPTGGNTWTDAGIKSHRDILRVMSPGKAKCSCEKNACRWAWSSNWNYKGMYQTEYVPAGVEEKGIGKVIPGFPAKKIYPLRYSLNPDEFKLLAERFPEWQFIGAHGGSHDHPVAHTSTRLAADRLLDSLVRGTPENPKVYLDLNGNPSANEAYMARTPGIKIISFVELITPKDYIRKNTKWGPQFNANGDFRWVNWPVRDIPRDFADVGDTVDGIISIHTAYYYDPQEIINLLAWAPRANFHALMHKFDGYSGTLNNKEQRWIKEPRGSQMIITQTNVASGEQYNHPDNSWWYEHDSHALDHDAMGWTINLMCDETYHITATHCPAVQARMSTNCVQIKPLMPVPAHSTARAQTQSEIARTHKVRIDLYGARSEMPIQPEFVDFFGEVRRTAINRPRSAKQYQDHVSRCKVKAGSVMTTSKLKIDAQQLSDIARFSFFIDYEDQYGSDKLMFDQTYVTTLMADPLYKSGAGVIMNGTLSMLCDILMGAAEAKDLKMAIVKGARSGIQHLNRNKLLNTL